jgi:PAS domain S-box-containing protein
MESQTAPPELAAILRRAAHPPIHEGRFWAIQAMLLLLAILHVVGDSLIAEPAWLAAVEIPIALAIIPVVYSALQYGLVGSGATSVWAAILWLPDLLLPQEAGHAYSDLISLSMVVIVGIFVGFRIESERLTNARAHRATAELLSAEARYRQLFEANRAPILVLDDQGLTAEVNPAARALLGADVLGRPIEALLGVSERLTADARQVLRLPDGREYRFDLVSVPGATSTQTQIVFEDVTAERSEGRRATRYAALVVQAEEDQRRRLARELHDEPLQLFLHLARRLESLGGVPGVPAAVARDLAQARSQSLEAAARLRTLARDLRPPTLDQLGLVAAVSSLVADIEDVGGLVAQLQVTGEVARLAPEVELGAFRIVQEAVRNTLNHARARHLGVSIGFESRELAFTVSDDGCGFAPEGLSEFASAHLGLVGMAERARLLGGQLEVRSAPGDGTLMAATIPLGPHARAVTDTAV